MRFFQGAPCLIPNLPAHGIAHGIRQRKKRHSKGDMVYGDIEAYQGPYTLVAVARWLSTSLQRHGHTHIHIVAHSMGGAIALLMAQRALQKKDGITIGSLICAEGNLSPHDGKLISRRAASYEREDFIHRRFPRLLERACTSDNPSTRRWGMALKETRADAFHAYAQSTTRWSSSGQLYAFYKMMSSPTLYLYGAESEIEDNTRRLRHDGMPLHAIEGAGHFMMFEQRTLFWQAVMAFYQEHGISSHHSL